MSATISYIIYGGFLAAILTAFVLAALSVAQAFADTRWQLRRDLLTLDRQARADEDAAWSAYRGEADSLYQRLLRADTRLLADLGIRLDQDTA